VIPSLGLEPSWQREHGEEEAAMASSCGQTMHHEERKVDLFPA
jgi:hypothetical protein